MLVMAKKKTEPKRYPSRENVKSAAITLAQYEALQEMGQELDRSVSWLVRKAIAEFLERQGRPAKKGE